MTTIVLTVSRDEFIDKVLTSVELLDCEPWDVNILCIVDGSDELFLKVRNLVNGLKFNERLTVRLDYPGKPLTFDVTERRKRISAAHNQAASLIKHDDGYVFSIEDDTTFGRGALRALTKVAISNRAFGMAEGVELGRWGVPYVGAWVADDIYEPKLLTSVQRPEDVKISNIDAGGLYCALIRTDLYKQHEFTSANGLGPDINFGLELRQLGFENFIDWNVNCTHHFMKMGEKHSILATEPSRVVSLSKTNDVKWHVSY